MGHIPFEYGPSVNLSDKTPSRVWPAKKLNAGTLMMRVAMVILQSRKTCKLHHPICRESARLRVVSAFGISYKMIQNALGLAS